MDNHKDSRCRSMKTSNRLVFAAKLLNDCLPTFDILLHRYKGLDINPNCVFCDQHAETLQHLVECTSTKTIWNQNHQILRDVFRYLQKKMAKLHEIHINFDLFLTFL